MAAASGAAAPLGIVRGVLRDGSKGPVVGLRQGERDVLGCGGPYAAELLGARRPRTLAGGPVVPQEVREDLERKGFAVWRDALNSEAVATIRSAAQRISGISRANHGQDPRVRTDKIRFLRLQDDRSDAVADADCPSDEEEDEDEDEAEGEWNAEGECNAMDQLAAGFQLLEHCAATLRPKLWRPRLGMVSCYAASGAFYQTHLDNEIDKESGRWRNFRSLTAILYINPQDWSAEDGGALECLVADSEPTRVLPKGGTIVLFNSRELLHQVLPSQRDRYALTLWFSSDDVIDTPSEPCGPRLLRLCQQSDATQGTSNCSSDSQARDSRSLSANQFPVSDGNVQESAKRPLPIVASPDSDVAGGAKRRTTVPLAAESSGPLRVDSGESFSFNFDV